MMNLDKIRKELEEERRQLFEEAVDTLEFSGEEKAKHLKEVMAVFDEFARMHIAKMQYIIDYGSNFYGRS